MKISKLIVFSLVLCMGICGVSDFAEADLWVDEARGLVYDSDQNLTWLRDADYGYFRYHDSAVSWVNNLVYEGYDDWRLPVADSSCQGTYPAYNCSNSELGHLFYTELGNTAGGPLTNTGPFLDIVPSDGGPRNLSGMMWTGTFAYGRSPHYYVFDFNDGGQSIDVSGLEYQVWAVREGNSGITAPVVPEPISSILFITGGLLLSGRRFIRRQV